jgi:hypothetical protein
VVDVKQRQIIVFRDPQEDAYRMNQVLGVEDAIAPIAFPEIVIELASLLMQENRSSPNEKSTKLKELRFSQVSNFIFLRIS